ncbi:MAG: hypothetical protein AAFQ01_00970, partial [Bacteroidota bacterium]
QFEFQTGWGKSKYKVKVSSNNLDRFPSPILFKFFDDHLYLLANPINPEILKKKIDFKVSFKDEQRNRTYSSDGFELKTPEYFDIEDFLDFALTDTNNEHRLQGYKKF